MRLTALPIALFISAIATQIAQAALLRLEVRQLPGTEQLAVAGQSVPNARLTLTLYATLSPDLPTVVVSREDVQSGVTGNFEAVLPVAPAYERGARIRVLATAADGASADAQLIMTAPNEGVAVPYESH